MIPVSTEPILTMRGIHKWFPGVHALDNVDFDVRPNEVHALLGENGAGKSTLIKILTGVLRRDAGTIAFNTQSFAPGSPAAAQQCGVHCVYQEVNVVPTQSVAENLFLGRFPRRRWGIDWPEVRRRSRASLLEFGLDLDVDEPLGSYSTAIQQMVVIARAVDTQARLLVFDEPTSSLDQREIEILFETIGKLKQAGIGIVYITHFLDEVYRVADRITVLRNGRRVGTFATAELPRLELVAHMLGKSPDEAAALENQRASIAASEQPPAKILAARGLGRRGAIAPFDIELHRGEVLGLAGLLGSGRTEAVRLLFGADRADSGHVEVNQRYLKHHSPRTAIGHGLAFCPEDRQGDGLVPDMSVRANIALVAQRALSGLGIVSRHAQDKIAHEYVRRLGIDTPDLDRPVRNLSGGNQQKVILARWLAARPLVLMLDEPTRGIDVGAKAEVEALIARLAQEGLAVIFISAELEEVLRDSHRMLVLRDRRVVRELRGDQLTTRHMLNAIAASDSHE
ncbi:MAG: sugar ABC transporter ATP-binding protein [Planctomycetota bacterium]